VVARQIFNVFPQTQRPSFFRGHFGNFQLGNSKSFPIFLPPGVYSSVLFTINILFELSLKISQFNHADIPPVVIERFVIG